MKFDILYNFISPITGRVLSDQDYMLIGDRQGFATPSPLFKDLKIDVQNLQHSIDNIPIEVTGAIDLKGKLSSFVLGVPNVLSSTFTPNPVFTGDSLHLPYGPTADRPAEPKEGMFRYNDEQDFLEYFNGSIWASLTSSVQPINISKEFATDMVYGVIANVNGGFNGFASLERDVDIRIQSSYYTKLLGDQSTASLSLLDRYDNGYINKTVSSSNGFFDYLLQKQDDGIKTDLLKFDNKVDEFIFNKHISYKGKNIIKYDEAVDMVTGVLNNSAIGLDGFATANKMLDIRIQSSYYVDGDSSHTSLSFLDRYENGYFFENSTNNDWSNNFSFNSINNEIKTELFKYDSFSNKFVFNKLVEVPYPINDDDAVNKLYVDSIRSGVQDVLGTSGQINSTGGQYPQISLDNSIIDAINRNYIESIEFNNNEISTRGFVSEMIINPSGDLIIKSDTIIRNNSVLKIYDQFNYRYTEIKPPYKFDTNITWQLPNAKGQQNQFLKWGSSDQLEWSNIDTGITSITAGNGLTGGTITSTGTIGLSSTGVSAGTYTNPTLTIDGAGRITSASNGQSSNLGNFQFNGDTMYTSGGSGQMNISNAIVNFAGAITTGGGVNMSGFGSSGFIWVDSSGSLQYTGPNGTTKLAN